VSALPGRTVLDDAWLLDIRGGMRVALGGHEMTHLIAQPAPLYPIPRAPAHCRCVVLWEDHVLPVVDLAALVGAAEYGVGLRPLAGIDHLLGVVAFAPQRGAEASRVALMLDALPEGVTVDDADACERSDEVGVWRDYAVSGFRHPRYGAVPILDLFKLFSSPLMGTRQ